jgi:HlyD family secretion protein
MMAKAKRRMVSTVAAIPWLGLCLMGCGHGSADSGPVVPVQVATVKRQPIQQMVSAEAVLYPLQEAAITPKVNSPVRKFYVQRGQRVHAGQLLAELENADLAAAELENKGAYAQAQANYENARKASLPEEMQKARLDEQQARQALDAQQKVFDSRQELYKEGALPRKELDQAQVGLVQARAQFEIAQRHLQALESGGEQRHVQAAKGELAAAQGKYLGAAAQLGFTQIRSPMNGVVTDRLPYPGKMPAAGEAVVTVMDLSQVIAKAHIPQEQAALLKPGDAATISAPDTPQKVAGRVTIVSPALDPGSTTVEVWVQAENPQQKLKPGSSVQLEMEARSVPDALVVPAQSLLTGPDGQTVVMVVGPDDKAHQTPVHAGIKQQERVQIVDGVQAGQRVITEGAYGLPDNTKVRVEPARAPAASQSRREEMNDPRGWIG